MGFFDVSSPLDFVKRVVLAAGTGGLSETFLAASALHVNPAETFKPVLESASFKKLDEMLLNIPSGFANIAVNPGDKSDTKFMRSAAISTAAVLGAGVVLPAAVTASTTGLVAGSVGLAKLGDTLVKDPGQGLTALVGGFVPGAGGFGTTAPKVPAAAPAARAASPSYTQPAPVVYSSAGPTVVDSKSFATPIIVGAAFIAAIMLLRRK